MVFILVSIAAGVVALVVTPREEEPQIIVAAANVLVSFPGHTAQDVEQLVSTPLEKMMIQIPGVEYVYSRSMPGQSIVTVRFYVGQPLEPSYVKLIRKLNENMDRTTPGAAGWVVKPIDVDDVPIVTFTLTSGSRDDYALRRMADEVVARLQGVDNAGVAYVVGGRPRELLIRPSATRMASYGIASLDLSRAIQASNSSVLAGAFDRNDRDVRVQAGQFIADARDLGEPGGRRVERPAGLPAGRGRSQRTAPGSSRLRALPPRTGLGSSQGRGGRGQPDRRTGRRRAAAGAGSQPAVTIAVAKKHGTNNVWVAEDLPGEDGRVEDGDPARRRAGGRHAQLRRHRQRQGQGTARGPRSSPSRWSWRCWPSGSGFRQALVVAIAVPCVFGLTLIVNYFLGFSINRISLFALTVALGLLVDDPIVDVENIHRHFQLRGGPRPTSCSRPSTKSGRR